jgi:hypothetical protein
VGGTGIVSIWLAVIRQTGPVISAHHMQKGR